VLYPGEGALTADEFGSRYGDEFRGPDSQTVRTGRKLLVFLVDATWVMARKMVHHTPSLQTLPRLSFSASYRSRFQIKKQPASFCLSTIESTYYLIREMQEAGLCRQDVSVDHLMDVFDRLNEFQMESERLGRAAGSAAGQSISPESNIKKGRLPKEPAPSES
ncbi:MAG: DTW domain-containing protein, partial [Spirochaetales bacterium]|nr:DTW domain-containing protein [Spirochaetales bacterium]